MNTDDASLRGVGPSGADGPTVGGAMPRSAATPSRANLTPALER